MSDSTFTLAQATDTMSYLNALVTDSSVQGEAVRAAWLDAAWKLQKIHKYEYRKYVPEDLDTESQHAQTDDDLSNEALEHLLDHMVDVAIPQILKPEVRLWQGCACKETHVAHLMVMMAVFALAPPPGTVRVRYQRRQDPEPRERQNMFMVNFLRDLFWSVKAVRRKTVHFTPTQKRWDDLYTAFRGYCEVNVLDSDKLEDAFSLLTSSFAGASSAEAQSTRQTESVKSSAVEPSTTVRTLRSSYTPLLPARPSGDRTGVFSQRWKQDLWYGESQTQPEGESHGL